jgi:thiamine kinase-like enzyme
MRRFYERLLGRLPGYFAKKLSPRVSTNRNLTLIHGDTYFCNFLCARIPGTGSAYLMDWQSPSCDLAAYDLVNLLAAFWSHAQRNESSREIKLLRRYYEGLQSRNVRDFSWDDLLADYRNGLVFWVLMPVQDAGDGAGPGYWIPKMRCLMGAFEDWSCWEIVSL